MGLNPTCYVIVGKLAVGKKLKFSDNSKAI